MCGRVAVGGCGSDVRCNGPCIHYSKKRKSFVEAPTKEVQSKVDQWCAQGAAMVVQDAKTKAIHTIADQKCYMKLKQQDDDGWSHPTEGHDMWKKCAFDRSVQCEMRYDPRGSRVISPEEQGEILSRYEAGRETGIRNADMGRGVEDAKRYKVSPWDQVPHYDLSECVKTFSCDPYHTPKPIDTTSADVVARLKEAAAGESNASAPVKACTQQKMCDDDKQATWCTKFTQAGQSRPHYSNQNGATSGFEIVFCYRIPAPKVLGANHVSHPA